jgi:hypothetical protein
VKTLEDIMERKAERQAAARERKEERKESNDVNTLSIEKEPTGLYFCRYTRGPVPDELKGMFTHKQKILDICTRRNIPVAL